MPIQSFAITNAKIIHKAFCESVPKLMIIAGPNGVGKSTLLNELRRLDGEKVKGTGRILYAGPHRTWRRRSIRTTWLWGEEREYSNILTMESIPGIEGLGVLDHHRRPDSTDEAPGFIKYILSQVETKRQNAIVSEIDSNDLKYPEGYAPDVYKPIKDMMGILLPHLHFRGIDQRNRNDVRCLMRVEGVQEPIDIDDLSSGEKEIIALFMPLLERQINQILRRMQKGKQPDLDVTPDTVMVLDEPDLHIHPELQRRMLKYVRKRGHEDNIQFIIATHSPILINEATSDELFALVEKDISGDDNQLRRVVSSQEKLDLFKYLCGDVAILTLGRPVVFIEGKDPQEMKNAPSDQRILELLWDGARDFTFIPMGGREEVEKATMILNQIVTEKLVGFPVYAIVNSDLDVNVDSSLPIIQWEFCTIENALLDSLSIYEVLVPYREKARISSREDVEKELLAICREVAQDEINKRFCKVFPSYHLHFKARSIEEAVKERDRAIAELTEYFRNPDEIQRQIKKIHKEVEDMISDKSALSKFNGKVILGKFYQKRVSEKGIGMGFDVFCYSIAEKMARNGRTPKSIERALSSIRQRTRT